MFPKIVGFPLKSSIWKHLYTLWKSRAIKILVHNLGWLKFPNLKKIVLGETYSFDGRLGLVGYKGYLMADQPTPPPAPKRTLSPTEIAGLHRGSIILSSYVGIKLKKL